jgi:hypothetical protein
MWGYIPNIHLWLLVPPGPIFSFPTDIKIFPSLGGTIWDQVGDHYAKNAYPIESSSDKFP